MDYLANVLSAVDTVTFFLQVAATFREKKIPCDVMWMDIDYMQDFKCFTFDKVLHQAG